MASLAPNTIPDPDEAARQLTAWLDAHHWEGWDPFDGLNSVLIHPLLSPPLQDWKISGWIRLAVLQAVKRSRVNLRPLLRVRPQENAMTWATGVLGAARTAEIDQEGMERVEAGLTRLLEMADARSKLWGYPFPWQARAFYVPSGTPNLVISAVCLRALALGLELAKVLEPPLTERIREHFAAACKSLLEMFGRDGFFSYVAHDSVLVHNANLLGCEILCIALAEGLVEPTLILTLEACLNSTLRAQEKTGRWAYGSRAHHQWADNFHTAYNLVSLAKISRLLAEAKLARSDGVDKAIKLGWEYYVDHAFSENGDARYFDSETYPLEAHSAAAALVVAYEMQAGGWIETDEALKLSERVYRRLIQNFYLGEGKFAYRRWRFRTVRQVYARWTQGWVYYGIQSYRALLRKEPRVTTFKVRSRNAETSA